jgi:hypothetical protein
LESQAPDTETPVQNQKAHAVKAPIRSQRTMEQLMRSDKVFDALHTLQNRYMLCQLASKATRKFHKPSTRIQDTTNEVLNRIAASERDDILTEPKNVSEAQRRAA